jgi:hypothetical protein
MDCKSSLYYDSFLLLNIYNVLNLTCSVIHKVYLKFLFILCWSINVNMGCVHMNWNCRYYISCIFVSNNSNWMKLSVKTICLNVEGAKHDLIVTWFQENPMICHSGVSLLHFNLVLHYLAVHWMLIWYRCLWFDFLSLIWCDSDAILVTEAFCPGTQLLTLFNEF